MGAVVQDHQAGVDSPVLDRDAQLGGALMLVPCCRVSVEVSYNDAVVWRV